MTNRELGAGMREWNARFLFPIPYSRVPNRYTPVFGW
jgi:hypothetical protein